MSGHWAEVAAGLFVPTREKLIGERLQAIEEASEQPVVEIADMIRAAQAKAAGLPLPLPEPVLPVAERVERERARLEAMTTEEILAEQEAEEIELAEMVAEARRRSEEQYQQLLGDAGRSADVQ